MDGHSHMPRHFTAGTSVLLLLGTTLVGQPSARVRELYERTRVNGGLIVHLGCADAGALAALRLDDRFLVRAYAHNPTSVERARQRLQTTRVYGKVSVGQLAGETLPLRDNLVNLLIAPTAMGVSRDELMRVLRPGGVLLLGSGQEQSVHRKPKTAETDDWTHFLYDSTNNAVSKDKLIGPPDAVQWIDSPKWTRSHDYLSSFTVGVSEAGRFTYIADDAPVTSVLIPPRWRLTCRDAYNGTVLWRRDIPKWFDHLHYFRNGPNYLLRRLVAFDGRVAVTLGWTAPVSILGAATGKTVLTLAGTDHTEEIIYHDGVLFMVRNKAMAADAEQYYRPWWRRAVPPPVRPQPSKAIAAYSVATGERVWQKEDPETRGIQELSLACDGKRVCYLTSANVVCLNATDGMVLWKQKRRGLLRRPKWSAPTLVMYRDAVFVGDRNGGTTVGEDKEKLRHVHAGGLPGVVAAYSLDNGRKLWECPTEDGFHVPVEVFAINDAVWTGQIQAPPSPGFTRGRNYRTGKVVFERRPDPEFRAFAAGHNRCHRNKATERYIITGRSFLEWTDVRTGDLTASIFTRGACSFGVLPANGLLYVPPSACMCAWERKVTGIAAFASSGGRPSHFVWQDREPVRGESVDTTLPGIEKDAWPTYRHDNRRTGTTGAAIQLPLKRGWQSRPVGGKLSSLTAAWGRVYAASPQTHSVVCFDAGTGAMQWRTTVGGPVDSPPTLWQGRAIFGSRDGSLYALDGRTGQTVWRLQLAHQEMMVPAFGHLESAWPVHGSALVTDGFIYTMAGRSSFLDGGLCLFKVNAATGTVVRKQPLVGVVRKRGQGRAFLPDILSEGTNGFYMGRSRFSRETLEYVPGVQEHLWSPTGFLDDNWMHRTYWLFGKGYVRKWTLDEREMPVAAGRLLCIDQAGGLAFGFGRSLYGWGIQPETWRAGHKRYQVRATPISPETAKLATAPDPRGRRRGIASARRSVWAVKATVEARAMAVTRDHVLLAGPRGKTVFSDGAFRGEEGSDLQVLDKATGKLLQELPLPAMPAFDGLIVAYGRVHLSLRDGSVICFEHGGKR